VTAAASVHGRIALGDKAFDECCKTPKMACSADSPPILRLEHDLLQMLRPRIYFAATQQKK
jgi:hypothetical protein